MRNIGLPALRKHAIDGEKRFLGVISLITAAALSASLIAGAAGPASAAVRGRAPSAPISLASSGNGLQALSLMNAARLNGLLDHETASAHSARVVVDVAKAVPADAQDKTITVLPGITLTINSTEIQLHMTKEAVTEVENLLGFGQAVASLVGAILATAGVGQYASIAAIVAAALGLGSDFLKLCTASDGSATFTVPFLGHGLPSCSGLKL